MDRLQFLEKIFLFYGKEQNPKNRELLKDYDLALTTSKNIDWDKLYNKTIKETETKYLPMPKWFIAKFDDCIKVDEQDIKFDGGTGILKLRYTFYTFDMSGCTHTFEEIIRKFKEKYKDSFVSFKYYPVEYKIINNRIFDKDMQLIETV